MFVIHIQASTPMFEQLAVSRLIEKYGKAQNGYASAYSFDCTGVTAVSDEKFYIRMPWNRDKKSF